MAGTVDGVLAVAGVPALDGVPAVAYITAVFLLAFMLFLAFTSSRIKHLFLDERCSDEHIFPSVYRTSKN